MQWYYRPEVEAQALRQVERMIFHLGSHPSIAVWCMHNEPFRAFDLRERYRPRQPGPGRCSPSFSTAPTATGSTRSNGAGAPVPRPHPGTPPAASGERGLFRKGPGDGHLYYGWYFGPCTGSTAITANTRSSSARNRIRDRSPSPNLRKRR